MIDKVQYSDYNRFLVSTGYVLVAIGLFLPYFYLRENFDLQIETTKIPLLTPIARQIISEKHSFSLLMVRAIPVLSLSFISLGIVFLIIGGNRWRKRQKVEDEKLDEEVAKLKKENKRFDLEFEKNLGAKKVDIEEVYRIKEREIEYEHPSITEKEKRLSAQAYFAVEGLIVEKFKNEFSDRYNVLTNYRINNFEFDIILSPIKDTTQWLDLSKDVIVEIKYSTKRITTQYAIDSLEHVRLLISNYPKPITNPIVFFIMADSSEFDDSIRQEIETIWSQRSKKGWRLIFTDLKKLSVTQLKDKIII